MPRIINIANQRFGRLIALEIANQRKNGTYLWACRCNCGKKTIVDGTHLRRGLIRSCGCLQRERDREFEDITGQRFGRLTALAPTRSASGRFCWLWRCDCGKETVARSGPVRAGQMQSCGCFRIERVRAAITTHGASRTPEYDCWIAMFQRCYNPKNPMFKYYGGRGIEVCERWHKFENFLADMGRRPAGRYSIERIDNDGNYEPRNCKWIPQGEQAKNTRKQKRKHHAAAVSKS